MDDLIEKACDPMAGAPNLELQLEVCDIINQKQKGYPREAGQILLNLINGRNEQVTLNALSLLDILVKNCGYPFHIVVASKEFLNELVRKFPERPTGTNMSQYRILELIQQWNATLCVTSRYKDDFKNITDMYRLLSYKGYSFPSISKDAAAVMSLPETLKSEDELEEEDRVAQGAKLQELLRQGTPAALEQANELMKVMAGYDIEKRPDYKKKVNEELDRIEAKAIQLGELLQSPSKGYDLMEDLVGVTKSAQARIQKLISDGDDDERIDRLLQLNDLINTVLEGYETYKRGGPLPALNIQSHTSQARPAVAAAAPQSHGAINLIDFDDTTIPDSSPFSSKNFIPPTSELSQLKGVSTDIQGLDFLNDLASPPKSPYAPSPLVGGSPPKSPYTATSSACNTNAPDLKKEATLFAKNGLQIIWIMSNQGSVTTAVAKFINTTPVPFTNLSFQLAVPKEPIRLRFKVSYAVNGAMVQESGEYSPSA
ncbi:hypothetical protein HDV05_001296 [Chytridiales sp. JEL 0842]|nr:hypothetical protein HDV05_001296 [Chytridiales sp. JEL 0842]